VHVESVIALAQIAFSASNRIYVAGVTTPWRTRNFM
jgi:hypothetical protein